jgi:hypothetical protein
MIFGTDCGHYEGMWPEVPTRMRELFDDIPIVEVEGIVGDDFLRAYQVDREAVAAVPATIGPLPEELGVVA